MSGEPSTAAPYFDRTERSCVDQIAGVSGNEELANTVAAEDQFRGNAAVGAGDDRRPWRLVSRDRAALRRKVDRAEFRMADVTLVSRCQLGERLVGGQRGRLAFSGRYLPGHAAKPERNNAGRAELQEVPPTDPLGLAIAVNNPVPPSCVMRCLAPHRSTVRKLARRNLPSEIAHIVAAT
jgi:hypothetical protein